MILYTKTLLNQLITIEQI